MTLQTNFTVGTHLEDRPGLDLRLPKVQNNLIKEVYITLIQDTKYLHYQRSSSRSRSKVLLWTLCIVLAQTLDIRQPADNKHSRFSDLGLTVTECTF